MSQANGDHDHDDDETVEGELAITFNLREEDIAKLGLSTAACEQALLDALEAQAELEGDDAPAFEEIKLNVAGREVRLGDIADIEMTTTFDDLDDEDDDEDDDYGLDDDFDEEDDLDESEEAEDEPA